MAEDSNLWNHSKQHQPNTHKRLQSPKCKAIDRNYQSRNDVCPVRENAVPGMLTPGATTGSHRTILGQASATLRVSIAGPSVNRQLPDSPEIALILGSVWRPQNGSRNQGPRHVARLLRDSSRSPDLSPPGGPQNQTPMFTQKLDPH